jgi:hypothetical protein
MLYSADCLSDIHFFKGAESRVPSQEKPMAFDPVNPMADKLVILSVHDDIADPKIVRLLNLELIAYLKRWGHALGTHERRDNFP